MHAPISSMVPVCIAAPGSGARRGCVAGCLKEPFRIAVCVSMAHALHLMGSLVMAARGNENSDKMPPGYPGGRDQAKRPLDEDVCHRLGRQIEPGRPSKRFQALAFCPARCTSL